MSIYIEDIISPEKYYPVEIKEERLKNTYFEVRELTTREEKELTSISLKGVKRHSSELVEQIKAQSKNNETIETVDVDVDISLFELNNYNANIYLIRTAYKYGKEKTDKLVKFNQELLDSLKEEEINAFVNAYNEQFQKVDSFPEGKKK